MIRSANQHALGMEYEQRALQISRCCLFCGEQQHRYMCASCRQKNLFQIFWEIRVPNVASPNSMLERSA